MIGHAMGAAGALELAGNLPSLFDGMVHPTTNIENLDEKCALPQLVANKSKRVGNITTIQNNSRGMLGINAVVIVKRVEGAPVPKAMANGAVLPT